MARGRADGCWKSCWHHLSTAGMHGIRMVLEDGLLSSCVSGDLSIWPLARGLHVRTEQRDSTKETVPTMSPAFNQNLRESMAAAPSICLERVTPLRGEPEGLRFCPISTLRQKTTKQHLPRTFSTHISFFLTSSALHQDTQGRGRRIRVWGGK